MFNKNLVVIQKKKMQRVFFQPSQTMNVARQSESLNKWREAFQRKKLGRPRKGIVFQLDIGIPQIAINAKDWFQIMYWWEV